MSNKADRIYVEEVRVLAETRVPFTSEFLRGIGEPIGKNLWESEGMEPNAFFIVSRLWADNAIQYALDEGWIEAPWPDHPETFVGVLTKVEDPPGPPRARPPTP
jgi:hypothetical protein